MALLVRSVRLFCNVAVVTALAQKCVERGGEGLRHLFDYDEDVYVLRHPRRKTAFMSVKLHGRSADDDERVRMRGEVLFERVESFYHSVFSSSLSVAIWMRGSVAPFSEM